MMIRVIRGTVGALALAFALPSGVFARGSNVDLPSMQHADGTIHVSADIVANCLLQTTPLNFGLYDPLVTNATLALSATTTESATCTKGVSAQLALQSQSSGAVYPNPSAALYDPTTGSTSASVMSSRLQGSANTQLTYAFTTALNAGSTYVPNTGNYAGGYQGTIGFTGAGVSQPQTIQFTGTIAPGQDVPSGAYADTIVATLSF